MENIDLEAIPVKKDTQAGRRIDDESMVVVDCTDATYRLFNKSASFIWSHIDGKQSVDKLNEALAQEFSIDIECAKKDVDLFLKELDGRGMIQWHNR